MENEKQTSHEFDFFKKNPVVKKIKEVKSKVSIGGNKKNKTSTYPKGLYGVLISALGLYGLHQGVEYSGWVLFLGILKLDAVEALIPFALCVLGLLGLYNNVEYAGWLLFMAYVWD